MMRLCANIPVTHSSMHMTNTTPNTAYKFLQYSAFWCMMAWTSRV